MNTEVELHDLYDSPDTKMFKLRMTRWMGQVTKETDRL